MAAKITMSGTDLQVPDQPIIPFIEGDGIGPDIWNAAVRVFDAAVEKAYSGSKKIEWLPVLAGSLVVLGGLFGNSRCPGLVSALVPPPL